MSCPCCVCLVDAICNKACEKLLSYIFHHDINGRAGFRKLPSDLPKSRRLAYRIGKLPAYVISHETCLLLHDHFNGYRDY